VVKSLPRLLLLKRLLPKLLLLLPKLPLLLLKHLLLPKLPLLLLKLPLLLLKHLLLQSKLPVFQATKSRRKSAFLLSSPPYSSWIPQQL
jgi:hypothetical protein